MKSKYNTILNDYIVDEWKKISKLDDRLIIINGNKGSGKRTVLNNNQNLYTGDRLIINGSFDLINFSTNNFSKNFLKYYYELILSDIIINSYSGAEFKILKNEYQPFINRKIEEAYEYINSSCFEDNNKYNNISLDLTKEILDKINDEFPEKKKTLIISNFDRIHSGEELVQNILAQYFNLFDQTIISTSDNSEETEARLDHYKFIQITYAKKIEFINNLIINYYMKYKSIHKNFLLNDNISYETMKYMRDLTSGNISLILETLYRAFSLYEWEAGEVNINKILIQTMSQLLVEHKKIQASIPQRKLIIK